ncbi:asparaginase domain-containing protein [Simiduia agarivorans]|uniref:Asparaginase n=1 Tax=Simiduia agarivorans (strain DSM 21679 / JCM 13881 / BCRC 17597 / SA1) TaxID=1117647 RepID=K4KGV0_SIMAS|nr:asparaginase domain-containing protein [Simiduia agarivorans]AFU98216.1 asparaginase [Simiduia agarivorans SA1 = DSM 21679]
MSVTIITTGGTIDKIYYDAKNDYHIGQPQAPKILERAGVTLDTPLIPLFRKDSLDITDEDRALIRSTVEQQPGHNIVITHGTDTMTKTGVFLQGIKGKTIVLMGAMYPAEFRDSDAVFNLGAAIMAAQTLPEGVYIAMNGRVFNPAKCVKNVAENRFEEA